MRRNYKVPYKTGCGRWRWLWLSVCRHCYIQTNERLPCEHDGCDGKRWKEYRVCFRHRDVPVSSPPR